MSGLQDFLSALRSGNIEVARQIYTTSVPRTAYDTMTERSQVDELSEDKSPRRWREDAATGARQAGVNRDGSAAISGDNALGIGAVDINPLTAVPAAMADFKETRERVKQGDAGPFEYGLTAAAIPLAAAPAVGGAAGRMLSRSGKALDNAATGVGKQMRKLLGQEVPMSVRMPDNMTVGQKIDVANTSTPELRKPFGELEQQPFVQDEDLLKPEANPARSRETETYYHGIKPKSKHGKEWSDWNVDPAVDRDSALENRNRIIEGGFRKGASAELGDAGTSVSGDPTMSLRDFAKNDSSIMLIVNLENAVNTQNTDPYTYLTRQHREANPAAVRKPNVFKEDETFFRTEGGGQEQLRARLPTEPEINFMERGSEAVDDAYSSMHTADEKINSLPDSSNVTAKKTYDLVRDFTQSVSNLREFGRANSTSAAYDAAFKLTRQLGRRPSLHLEKLGPTAREALSDTYGWANDLNNYRDAFDGISDAIKYDNEISSKQFKSLQDVIPRDLLEKATRISDEALEDDSRKFVEGPELKQLINGLYSNLQKAKTQFLNSADKLSVAFAAGAAGSAMSGEAEARDMADMDAAATLPDSNILEELKSVQSMINDARTQEKINDPATLKAIRTKHKELLSKLIDSAMEE